MIRSIKRDGCDMWIVGYDDNGTAAAGGVGCGLTGACRRQGRIAAIGHSLLR